MKVVVLGAAAGGGFPQWNSNGAACRRARAGDPAAKPRTQTSVAVSADRKYWFILNAAPDLRQQIEATPVLWPSYGLRSSPIAGVLLTGGDVDAIAGLLTLRERQPFSIYATPPVLDVLERNSVFDVLARDIVSRRPLQMDVPVKLELPDGTPSGLVCTAYQVPGKMPLYLESVDDFATGAIAITEASGTVGLRLEDAAGAAMFFIPGCAAMTPALAQRLRQASIVLFDGTLWTDDEMVRAGLGRKTGSRMGHMSVSGPDGTMAAFAGLGVRRKVLIHINNSNPILLDDSPERLAVAEQGWEVAWDGMELEP